MRLRYEVVDSAGEVGPGHLVHHVHDHHGGGSCLRLVPAREELRAAVLNLWCRPLEVLDEYRQYGG